MRVHSYSPGEHITAEATTAVAALSFVQVSGPRGGAGLKVKAADAGSRPLGVAAADAAVGELLTVVRDGVVYVKAGGAIAAGASVAVGAAGAAVAGTENVVGIAVDTAADGVVELALNI